MTDRVDEAVDAIRHMSPSARDSVAQAILSIARNIPLHEVDPEHLPYVLEGLIQIERGEFATDEEVAEAFRSFEK